jgi:Zn-dependent protease with chaperone function
VTHTLICLLALWASAIDSKLLHAHSAQATKGDFVAVPPASPLAMEYYRSGNVLWAVGQIWALAVPAFFLFSGLSAKLREHAQRMSGRWYGTIIIYFIGFSIIAYVLNWPLRYYAGFVRQHAYGLSQQSFAKWQGDSCKSLGVGIVAGCLFLWIPYLLLRKSPRRWWLYSAVAYLPIAFFVAMIVPIWVDPLFHHFGEMKNKHLEERILALARRAGIEGTRVYEVDMSRDTKTVNAYVTGLMDTKRIVLWDTIIEKLTEPELLTVVGHEMGHYVLHHVAIGITLSSVGVLFILLCVQRLAGALLKRYGSRWGFTELADIASLPLIFLIAGLINLVAAPIGLAGSRYFEHEADCFGLEITKDNRDMALAFVQMQENDLDNPWPGLLYKLWRSSHPPIGERIDFCNHYRPWETGEPLKYEDLFQAEGR